MKLKLESELLEEPFVLARLVPVERKKKKKQHKLNLLYNQTYKLTIKQIPSSPLLKLDLSFPPCFAFQSGISEDVLVDNSFVQRNIYRVSAGNQFRHYGTEAKHTLKVFRNSDTQRILEINLFFSISDPDKRLNDGYSSGNIRTSCH